MGNSYTLPMKISRRISGERFWKDVDECIKYMQWEKLRQVNFSDDDQFLQQFEELAYYARVHNSEQVMITQIKKAAQETSKNTIYLADGDLPISYKGWKARLPPHGP